MKLKPVIFLAYLTLTLTGCYWMGVSSGGGQTRFSGQRLIDASDVAVPPGYQIEVVATGLTFPTGIAFDGQGRAHVTESGYSYGEVWTTPRLIRLGNPNVIIAEGGRNGPWNGVTWQGGNFYVAEGGQSEGGKILRISAGKIKALVSGLPSLGDHHTNGPVAGPDGWIYFGQGTATNSGIVGEDDREFGWLDRHPDFHDFPAKPIVVHGSSPTGAFSPYHQATTSGQMIPASRFGSGTIMRLRPGGGEPQLVAWGFRNPFGLAFSPSGQLFATENGYDNRGSRPVWGAPDVLWQVHRGMWHGWPDFSGNRPLTDEFFRPPHGRTPGFLIEHPSLPPAPAALFAVHSSANGLDFSRSKNFGHLGEAFVAETGDMAPSVDRVMNPVGFKVVRVNVVNGEIEDFAVNRGGRNGPASKIGGGGLERPVAARFSPDGNALYVVDFGVMTMHRKKPQPRPGTGVVWKISREGAAR